jgi:cytochrome b
MATGEGEARRVVTVWDLPTRLFHWLTAVLVTAAWLTERLNWMDLHVDIGEALLALVLFRLGWGLLGSESARFAGFLASPAAAARHLAHMLRREPDVAAGHNPAGGWMVLVLLTLLLAETLTGLVVYNDIADEGPLTERMSAAVANGISAAHAWLWYAILAAVALHLAAITLYALLKGQDLVRPMVTGRKRLPACVRAPRMAPPALALLVLAAGAAVALLLGRFS